MSRNSQTEQVVANETEDLSTENSELIRQVAASYSGPLPPPGMLEHYNNIVPGAAERILSMAEKQSEHRQKLEEKIVNSETSKSFLGLWFAFFVVMASLLVGGFLIINDKEVFGLVSMAGPLSVIVGMFIYREKNKTD